MTKSIIRPMTGADVAEVYKIDKQSFSLPWTLNSYLFEVNENEASRNWVLEVVRDGGSRALAGFIVVWLILDEAHIGTIAVKDEFRGRGLGRELLAFSLLKTLEEGATTSMLEVRQSNVAAIRLYTSLGYEVVAVRKGYYRDNNEDALLMNLAPIDADILSQAISKHAAV